MADGDRERQNYGEYFSKAVSGDVEIDQRTDEGSMRLRKYESKIS